MATGAMLVAFLILCTAAAAALDTCEYISRLYDYCSTYMST
jgi:hypothetical protein